MVREGGAYANGCPLPTRGTNGGILFSLSQSTTTWISWRESQTITPLLLQMLFKFGFGGLEATNVEATSSYLSSCLS
ncbi:hypothetical protein ES332_D05G411400v1 [Gossypium tomentosum]|uniref:Uncharacterized protein n=1 Tax=Gossypium tomentosum TaxID=34277 RepID=A0A5D2L6E6_GOSTO|nr:hypothetical protein ES332_D05G411400v1 [Gossypium tomentosum]